MSLGFTHGIITQDMTTLHSKTHQKAPHTNASLRQTLPDQINLCHIDTGNTQTG